VNVDLDQAADLCLDLREPLPFPDNSVNRIYSEHFFEHLGFEEGAAFLKECHRVLLPGGRLSVGVPDARLCLQDYVADDREKWRLVRDRYGYPAWCSTPMHGVNHFFRQNGEHQYAYDEETLVELIQECGFSNVHGRPWDPALDLEARREGTLYVDGEKTSF
jgi:predicted SAM-dependent methyltransferase